MKKRQFTNEQMAELTKLHKNRKYEEFNTFLINSFHQNVKKHRNHLILKVAAQMKNSGEAITAAGQLVATKTNVASYVLNELSNEFKASSKFSDKNLEIAKSPDSWAQDIETPAEKLLEQIDYFSELSMQAAQGKTYIFQYEVDHINKGLIKEREYYANSEELTARLVEAFEWEKEKAAFARDYEQ